MFTVWPRHRRSRRKRHMSTRRSGRKPRGWRLDRHAVLYSVSELQSIHKSTGKTGVVIDADPDKRSVCLSPRPESRGAIADPPPLGGGGLRHQPLLQAGHHPLLPLEPSLSSSRREPFDALRLNTHRPSVVGSELFPTCGPLEFLEKPSHVPLSNTSTPTSSHPTPRRSMDSPAPPTPPSRIKIIHAGFFRTGTNSLATAYQILGFKTCHGLFQALEANPWVEIERAAEAKWPDLPGAPSPPRAPWTRADWDALWGRHYDVVTDISSPFTRELIAAYPDAKVVVVQRTLTSGGTATARWCLTGAWAGRTTGRWRWRPCRCCSGS